MVWRPTAAQFGRRARRPAVVARGARRPRWLARVSRRTAPRCLSPPIPSSVSDSSNLFFDFSPLTSASSPSRGPLIERAERLRGLCIQEIGDANYRRALQVWKTKGPDGAHDVLVEILGQQRFEAVVELLGELLMCEDAIVVGMASS